jgi:hypothetical protein
MNTGACLTIKKRFPAFLNLSSFIIISSLTLRLGSWFFIRLTYFKLLYILIIVPRTPSKKALPKRSRVIPVKLARKTYLRCSKRVSVNPTHRYRYKDFQKYISCVYKRKDYEPVKVHIAVTTPLLLMVSQIPRKFVPEINHLLTLARDLTPEEENYERRLAELKVTQK